MNFKYNTKQRNKSVQGLRSFKDTLPQEAKRILNKKGQIYSNTLDNWKFLVGKELFNELNIPIGLIHSSWGGTSIEAWTPMISLEKFPSVTKNIEDRYKQAFHFLHKSSISEMQNV